MTALKTRELSVQFGGLKACENISLEVAPGVIFGLIGPNGAGKTTLFNLLTGVYQPTSGSMEYFGKPVARGLRPHQICRLGVARTFQNIRLFRDLSVLDNLLVASDAHSEQSHCRFLASIFRSPKFKRSEYQRREFSKSLLARLGLLERADHLAGSLSYGDQRRLEIARALATGAKLLLLDEPAAGLNPQETMSLMQNIRDLRRNFSLTIILIEHDMRLVMGVCERIAVLDHGQKIAEGSPDEVRRHPQVIEAYLGRGKGSA